MENFISHTKSVIDFRKFKSVLIIGSHTDNPDVSNGAGKSAIFNAIRWVLYNKTRFSTKEKIVKRGCSKCKVVFIFELGEDTYKIVRQYSCKNNIMDVVFYKLNNGKWVDKGYTCDTNTLTTDRIIEVIGMSHDTFINSVYFSQSDIAGFAGATTAKRKNILKEVLQIGVWDEFQKSAKASADILTIQQENLNKRLELLKNIKEEISDTNVSIKDKNNNIDKLDNNIRELENEIAKIQEQIIIIEANLTNIADKKRLEMRLSQIRYRAEQIKTLRNKYKEQVIKNNSEIANYHNECLLLNSRELKLCEKVLVVSSHRSKEEAEKLFLKHSAERKLPVPIYSLDVLDRRKENRETLKNEKDRLSIQIEQLTSLKPGKECPICLSKLNLEDVENRRKIKLTFLQNQLIQKEEELKELDYIIEKDQRAVDEANTAALEINQVGLIIAKYNINITEAEKGNKEIQSNLSALSIEWNELKQEKTEIEGILNSYNTEKEEELLRLNSKKDKLNEELEKQKKELIKYNIEKGQLLRKLEELEAKKDERNILIKQKEDLLIDLEAYLRLSKAFGKDGIQSIIMENIAEDLRSYTNSILCKLSVEPMSVDFITQRKMTTGNWKEDFEININIDGNSVFFDDLSGGEQVRVAFALRLALSRLLMRRVGSDIRFLLLDEVDQSLDKYGVEVLAESIHTLANEFKILLITHNDLMKDKFENIISVQKGPVGSSIKQ